MTSNVTLFRDLEWTVADDPDASRHESGISKHQLRYFLKTRSPLGQLVRQMNEGDSLVLVDTNEITRFKAVCRGRGNGAS